jgi:hypothetical protein
MPPKVVCGNPLFLGWLEGASPTRSASPPPLSFASSPTVADPSPADHSDRSLPEAANDAAAKGSKMEFAYKKAARSLKQCPLTFEHPEQTRQLVGVGDTIIN